MLGTPLNGTRNLTLPSLQEKQQVIKTDIVIKGKKNGNVFFLSCLLMKAAIEHSLNSILDRLGLGRYT